MKIRFVEPIDWSFINIESSWQMTVWNNAKNTSFFRLKMENEKSKPKLSQQKNVVENREEKKISPKNLHFNRLMMDEHNFRTIEKHNFFQFPLVSDSIDFFLHSFILFSNQTLNLNIGAKCNWTDKRDCKMCGNYSPIKNIFAFIALCDYFKFSIWISKFDLFFSFSPRL